MEEREVLGREAALLEQRDGERVAERHGRGRAGRGRETERAGLLRHAHVEDDVRAAREGRLEVAADGNQRDAEPARQRQEAQHLGALAAVRDREQHVAAHERAEIAVAALAGVQEEGGRAGRGERGGDLPAHDAGLADARDDHPPAAGEQELEGAREAPVEAVGERAQGPPLDVEHAPRAREPRFGGHRPRALPRSARSMATSSPRSAGRSASGTLVAPSERARLGSSCTSRKTASATAATWATCSFSCTSVSTGSPVSRRTSARMARPSSMPTPRKPSSEVRFALSKEDLYTTGSPARAAISRTRSAWRRAASRDSMTHGPAIRASGAPPPTVTVPTRTPRATSASPL